MWRGTRLELIIVVILWNYMKSQEAIYHNLSRKSDCPFYFIFLRLASRRVNWDNATYNKNKLWHREWLMKFQDIKKNVFIQNRFIKISLLKGKHVSTDICTNVVFHINFRGEKQIENPFFQILCTDNLINVPIDAFVLVWILWRYQ